MGGVLSGPRHSQGGIPGYIKGSGKPLEMEGGEIILNRRIGQSPAGLAMASELNASFGGVRFMEAGGPVNPLPIQSVRPGMVSMGTPSTDTLAKEMAAMRHDFNNLVIKIDRWPTVLQVHNNVQDTRKGINVINKLETDSGF